MHDHQTPPCVIDDVNLYVWCVESEDEDSKQETFRLALTCCSRLLFVELVRSCLLRDNRITTCVSAGVPVLIVRQHLH